MTYRNFAYVYDQLMKVAPYHWWVQWVKELVQKQQWNDPRLLELGCGTGSILIPLAEEGLNVSGLDLSEDMLAVASAKAVAAGVSPMLLHQDMKGFEVDTPVHMIYSLCDSTNYILEEDDVKSTFRHVYKALLPGGLYMFDYHTEYMLSHILGNETFTERDEDVSYIWESSFHEETCTVTYDISFFVKDQDGRYSRFEEEHVQKAFSQQEIRTWLSEEGFVVEHVFGDFTKEPPHEETERLFFIARKK